MASSAPSPPPNSTTTTTTSADIFAVRIASQVVFSTLLASLCFILVCHVVSWWESARKDAPATGGGAASSALSTESAQAPPAGAPTHRRRHVDLRSTLALTALFAGVAVSLAFAQISLDWRAEPRPHQCFLMPKFVAAAYVFSKQFVGLTLYLRAKVVHDALHLNSPRMRAFRWFMFLNVTVGVQAVYGWSIWVNYEGRVTPQEGVCVFLSVHPAIIVSFALCDALLSGGLLLLFIVPLREHMRIMRDVGGDADGAREQLRRTIVRNLVLSCLILAYSLSTLTALTVGLSTGGAFQEPVKLWTYFLAMVEGGVSAIALHGITRIWMPKRVSWHCSGLLPAGVNTHSNDPTSAASDKGQVRG